MAEGRPDGGSSLAPGDSPTLGGGGARNITPVPARALTVEEQLPLVYISATRCVNEYVASRLRESYVDLTSQLRAATAGRGSEKKNASKITALLGSLTAFELESSYLLIAAKFLQTQDDRKLARLSHYLMTYEYTIPPSSVETEVMMSIVDKELTNEALARRVYGIRTYARLLVALKRRGGDEATLRMHTEALSAHMNQLLRRPEAEIAKTGTRRKSVFSRAPTADQSTTILTTAYSACRVHFQADTHFLAVVLAGMKSPDPVAVRHVLALLLSYVGPSVETVALSIRRFMPHLPTRVQAVLTDVTARVQLVRIFGAVAEAQENDREDALQALGHCLSDEAPRVVIEAALQVGKVAQSAWDATARVTARPHGTPVTGGDVPNETIVQAAVRILAATLGVTKHAPTQAMALRAAAVLGRAYVTVRDHFENFSEHPMARLATAVVALRVAARSPYVRLQAIRAGMWLARRADVKELVTAAFAAEFHAPVLSKEDFQELYDDVGERVKATPAFAPTASALCVDWVLLHPDLVAPDTLVDLWRSIMNLGREQRKLVHEGINEVLDILHQPETGEAMEEIHKAAYWFLGENGTFLTQLSKDEQRTTTPGRPMTRQSSQLLATSQGAAPDETVDKNGNSLIDTDNLALKALVLRLQHGASFGLWQTRVLCIQALGKLALRSYSPLRLHIYEYLLNLTQDASSGLHLVTTPLCHVLSKALTYQADLVKARNENAPTPWLKAAHEELKAKMALFCFLPKNFYPLGPDSERLLAGSRGLSRQSSAVGLNQTANSDAADAGANPFGESATIEIQTNPTGAFSPQRWPATPHAPTAMTESPFGDSAGFAAGAPAAPWAAAFGAESSGDANAAASAGATPAWGAPWGASTGIGGFTMAPNGGAPAILAPATTPALNADPWSSTPVGGAAPLAPFTSAPLVPESTGWTSTQPASTSVNVGASGWADALPTSAQTPHDSPANGFPAPTASRDPWASGSAGWDAPAQASPTVARASPITPATPPASATNSGAGALGGWDSVPMTQPSPTVGRAAPPAPTAANTNVFGADSNMFPAAGTSMGSVGTAAPPLDWTASLNTSVSAGASDWGAAAGAGWANTSGGLNWSTAEGATGGTAPPATGAAPSAAPEWTAGAWANTTASTASPNASFSDRF